MPPFLAFLTGAPGGGELLVLFVVILLLFGPKRLPEIAKAIGRVMENLRRASQDFRDQVMDMDELVQDEPPPEKLPPASEEPAAKEDPDELENDLAG